VAATIEAHSLRTVPSSRKRVRTMQRCAVKLAGQAPVGPCFEKVEHESLLGYANHADLPSANDEQILVRGLLRGKFLSMR